MADWFAIDGDHRQGPIDEAALREAVRRGGLSRHARVWREGMAEWAPIRDALPDLALPSRALGPVGLVAYGALLAGVLLSLWVMYFDGLATPNLPLAVGLFIGTAAGLAILTPVSSFLAWNATRLVTSQEARGFSRIAIALTALLGAIMAGYMLYQTPQTVTSLLAQTEFADYRIEYDPKTEVVTAQGPVGPGYARALKAKLEIGPVRRFVITSPGGLSNEAMIAARLLERRKDLVVAARGTCLSACMIILMGGQERWADYDMVLGFHALAPVVDTNSAFWLVQTRQESRETDAYMRSRGVPEDHLLAAAKLGAADMHMVESVDLAEDGTLTGLVGIDDERIGVSEARKLLAQEKAMLEAAHGDAP